MKKFRRSPMAIACYAFAVVFAAYFISVVITTISTINEYYAAYGMSASAGEVITYLFQQGLTPLVAAIITCMAGIILEEVRKLNPKNWATEEELAEAREARKMAREAKAIAKGEAAKAAAEAAAAAYDDADTEADAESSAESDEPVFSAVVAEDEVEADASAAETNTAL